MMARIRVILLPNSCLIMLSFLYSDSHLLESIYHARIHIFLMKVIHTGQGKSYMFE